MSFKVADRRKAGTKVKYYVNNNAQQDSGDHEVHKETCYWLTLVQSKKYLGEFSNAHDAVREAKKYYSTADGCAKCCPEAHKS